MDLGTYRGNAEVACCSFLYSLWDASDLNQIDGKGFKKTESGAVIMDDDTRKTVLQTWQKKKQEMVQHTFLNEKLEIGLLPHAQAMLLARHLRGDLDAYPPYLYK
jgi:CRISPR-associated protein Cas1